MKIAKSLPLYSFILSTSAFWYFSTSSYCEDSSTTPKESLYFTNGKFTVNEIEKYPDFLLARNGINSENLKVNQMRNSVFIVPTNGPQIPVHASGFILLSTDRLKTGVDSRVNLMISSKVQMTLGEKTSVLFYQKQNKQYFKIESGNIRLIATELSNENKIYLETNEFKCEINKGDFAISVAKESGSSIYIQSGELAVETGNPSTLPLVKGEILTQIKGTELKRSKINHTHIEFVEDNLNTNFNQTNKGINLNDLVNSILVAPKPLIAKLASTNTDEKASAQLFDEVASFVYQNKAMPRISRGEAQAVARIIISYGKDLSALKIPDSANGEGNREDYLKELQNQMLLKAEKLKDLEEQFLREAEEAEKKAKSIK